MKKLLGYGVLLLLVASGCTVGSQTTGRRYAADAPASASAATTPENTDESATPSASASIALKNIYLIKSVSLPAAPLDMAINGDIVYLATYNGTDGYLQTVDVSIPSEAKLLSVLTLTIKP